MKPKLKDDTIYLGDNGRCYCGEHAGATARFTGCDLSGREVYEITLEDAKSYPNLVCEECGKKPRRTRD